MEMMNSKFKAAILFVEGDKTVLPGSVPVTFYFSSLVV